MSAHDHTTRVPGCHRCELEDAIRAHREATIAAACCESCVLVAEPSGDAYVHDRALWAVLGDDDA